MTTATLRNPPKATESQHRNFGVRPDLTLTAWAEQHVRVTEGPLVEGGASIPWSPETFPLQRTVMDSIESSAWSRTVLVSAPQAFGKTLCAAVSVLLYALAYLRVSAFYVAASAHLSVTQWRKKIEPALKADPELARLIHENPDFGGTSERHDFKNGTSLHMAGCQSVGSLSAFTASVVVCDDVQAYPETLPKFGHPADYASSRSEAYPAESCRHVFIGTAGSPEDWLWRSLRASAFFCPFVPCLSCGTYQLIEFDRFEFDAEDPDAARADTWMRCAGPDCDHHIVFDELPEMLERHLWVSMPPDADWIDKPTEGGVTIDPDEASVYPATDRNTNNAGFWCNALYWPYGRTWGVRAADHVSMKGDDEKLRTWQQNILVRPWSPPEVDEEALTVQELETHVSETGYEAKTVPAEADVVTVTVDVQSGYVYYLVRAWRRADGTSWLIDLGTSKKSQAAGFETELEWHQWRALGITRGLSILDQRVIAGWPHGTEQITATLGLIDRGYETDVVAGWHMVKHRGVWHTIKGAAADQKATLWPQKPVADSRNRPYRRVDVNQAKHTLRRLLRLPLGQPGYWHMPTTGLHRNTVRAYFRHMVSERFNRDLATPRWENSDSRTKKKANHFWDCYSDDTEVLTEEGWTLITEIGAHDKVATVNLATDALEYEAPLWCINKSYTGDMIQIGGERRSRVDLLVTPGHRMVVFKGVGDRDPKICRADELTIWHRLKIRASWHGDDAKQIALSATAAMPAVRVDTEDLADFLGWYIAEGYCNESVATTQPSSIKRRVTIYQSNDKGRQQIRALLSRLPWRFSENPRGFVIANQQVYQLVCELGNKYTKRVPGWIKQASPRVISAFLRGAVAGDGWIDKRNGALRYATVSKLLADDVAELFIKTGRWASIQLRESQPYSIRGRTGINTVRQYWVMERIAASTHLRDAKNRPNFKRVSYSGYVACVTVPNGTLIVRRNGKIAICGNCETYQISAAVAVGVQFPGSPVVVSSGKPWFRNANKKRRRR